MDKQREADLSKLPEKVAHKDYFFKMFFHSYPQMNTSLVKLEPHLILVLHGSKEDRAQGKCPRVYASKVSKGDKLNNVIRKELRSLFEMEEFEIMDILEDGYGKDRNGNVLKRFSVQIKIPFIDLTDRKINGRYTSWATEEEFAAMVKSGRR